MHVLLPLVPERRRGDGGGHWKEVKDKDTEPSEEIIHNEVKKQGKKYVYAKLVSREMLTEKSSSLFSIDTEALRECPDQEENSHKQHCFPNLRSHHLVEQTLTLCVVRKPTSRKGDIRRQRTKPG